MSNIKIELNSQGIRELLRSEWAAGECRKYAEKVKSAAGNGYEVQERRYPERTGYAVTAESREARSKNLKENVLLKAMGRI